jgi:hypothetical protein
MLRTLIVVAASAAAFAAPAAQREDRDAARIERALAGLTPGQPQSCINPDRSGNSVRYGDTLLVKGRSGITYLSHFDAGCAPRDDSYAMISRRPTSQTCRGDIVQFQDLTSGAFGGACAYGSFTPYRRVR